MDRILGSAVVPYCAKLAETTATIKPISQERAGPRLLACVVQAQTRMFRTELRLLVVAAALGLNSCDLNPQPDLPGNASSAGGRLGGSGASSAGGTGGAAAGGG